MPTFTKKFRLKTGTVIKSTGSWYHVIDEHDEKWECRIRGKLRIAGIKTTNPVAVGDEVEFEATSESQEEQKGVIKKILPRKNYIIRKSVNLSKRSHILAANIDHVYLLVTLKSPKTQTGFIDRFLVTSEAYHIPATILFNKVDLYSKSEMRELKRLKEMYENIGYRCETITATEKESVKFLLDEIKDKKVMFGGHSGVGKSTLIKTLDHSLDLTIGEISESHETGQHTTTFAEMHELKTGGYIIDTPGIKAFGLIDFDKKELSHYFIEMRKLLQNCKFNDCQHLDEPDCAVKAGLDTGAIHPERYINYISIMEADEEESYRKDIYG